MQIHPERRKIKTVTVYVQKVNLQFPQPGSKCKGLPVAKWFYVGDRHTWRSRQLARGAVGWGRRGEILTALDFLDNRQGDLRTRVALQWSYDMEKWETPAGEISNRSWGNYCMQTIVRHVSLWSIFHIKDLVQCGPVLVSPNKWDKQ